MKPIIVIDLEGALIEGKPFKKAQKEWFNLMSTLTGMKKDDSEDDYFNEVEKMMKTFLGIDDMETINTYARNLYGMLVIHEASDKDVNQEFAEYLRMIKDRYQIVMISTLPGASLDIFLEKIGCRDIFDIIYKSPVEKKPDKMGLFAEFMTGYGKPLYYIGFGDKNIEDCRELGIKTISVNWFSLSKYRGDHDILDPKELVGILED